MKTNKLFMAEILAIALVFGMTVVGCDDGSTDSGSKWWTWVSTTTDSIFDSTAKISMTPTSNDTGCDVTITGTANPTSYNWAVTFGYAYTATAGKTYIVTWKWTATGNPFENVTIRYIQQKDYQDDYKYQLGTNPTKLTIPTSEETKTFAFTMPANLNTFNTSFAFQVGEDTGSFRIRDFKIEEVK